MPERERLRALVRALAELLGSIKRVEEEVGGVLAEELGRLALQELYAMRYRAPGEDEMLEEIMRCMGLGEDSELVRLLRGVPRDEEAPGDRSG